MVVTRLFWTPRAKQRPRTTFQGGSYRTYTPHATRDAEADLRRQWIGQPLDGPLSLGLAMYDEYIDLTLERCPPPDNRKMMRGDLDNYIKLVCDALNGRAWQDDRQIVAMSARKM